VGQSKKFDADKDYYRVIGVAEDATPDEIAEMYRHRALESHPDRGGSEEAMKSLNEAHEVLSHPETRRAYDEERQTGAPDYTASPGFDPAAASEAGTLEIPVSPGEISGLLMASAACFGLGLPFLVLIEMQWVIFLWPLRLLTLGALGLGVLLARSALRQWLKSGNEESQKARGARWLCEFGFWMLVASGAYLLYAMLYAG
jgi:curved DNA-binding protein CbpA